MTFTVIEWDGGRLSEEVRRQLPEQLRDLPRGHYAIEPIEVDDELTAEERAGILEAIASIRRGEGIPFEEVAEDLRRRYAIEP